MIENSPMRNMISLIVPVTTVRVDCGKVKRVLGCVQRYEARFLDEGSRKTNPKQIA